MKRTILFAALLWPLACVATTTQTIPLGNRHYDVSQLSSATPAHSFSVDVSGAQTLVIDVTTPATALTVSVTDPGGNTLDPTTFQQLTIAPGDEPPLGAVLFDQGVHTQVSVDQPMDGTWTVTSTLPAGAADTTVTTTALATGGLETAASMSRGDYAQGEPAVLVVPIFHGGQPVAGASVTGNVFQDGTTMPIRTVQAHDDGNEPDASAGDGLYTAEITGLPTGHYLVNADVSANGQSGTAAADFNVTQALGSFTGDLTDGGVDTNGDGLFERVDLAAGVNVTRAGTYELLGELTLPGGKKVRAGAQAELPAGTSTFKLGFQTADIKTYLGADGPYGIQTLELVKLSPDGSEATQVVDRLDDAGQTGPYTLDQFQRPVTLIADGLEESPADTNGNGLYDTLTISFTVDTLRTGYYTWTGNLKSSDGKVIVVASNSGYLSAGQTKVSFTFDGETIGENGVDGPYVVGNVAAYGPPNAAAVREKLGLTSALLSSQFEGGAATFDTLIAQVRSLVITGIGGKPRADGIRTSLLQKATNAKRQYDKGHTTPARNLLNAFVNEVQAQSGKHIAADDSERLATLVQSLEQTL